MAYEILDSDLFDDSKSSKKRKKNNKKLLLTSKDRQTNHLLIHIILILIIIGLLIYFLMPKNISSKTTSEKENLGHLTIIGDITNFNKSYSGNLTIDTEKYQLITNSIKLDETSKKFEIENFKGNIHIQNKSITFQGTAKKLTYGNNELLLNNDNFKLTSYKKTKTDLYFKTLQLTFLDGKVVLDDGLNYDFLNSSFKINNFNTTFSYDGKYSFVGTTNNFIMTNSQNKLKIIFDATNETTISN